jgi:hypothetical protein
MATVLRRHDVIKSADLGDLRKQFVCMNEGVVNEDCAIGRCKDCTKKLIFDETQDLDRIVTWSKWTHAPSIAQNRKKETMITRRLSKVEQSDTLATLVQNLEEELCTRGARHLAVYKHQERLLQTLKTKLSSSEAIILMDFSENYSCKYAEEVQSFHFGGSRNQVTIHDGVVYHSSGNFSFATLSDCRRHDPIAIWTYIQPLFNLLSTDHPNINTVHFWTDGPTTQYRSKLNFYLFSICKQFSRASTWNLSGAGHGKNAADGVGGAIKRTADSLVGQGVDIFDAQTLFENLVKSDSKIKLFFVPEREVEENERNSQIQKKLDVIPGTMKIQQVGLKSKPGTIWYRDFGCFCSLPSMCQCYQVMEHHYTVTNVDNSCREVQLEERDQKGHQQATNVDTGTNITELKGKWVIVFYEFECRPYPGKVLETDEDADELTVTVMRQKGNNSFNWPTTPDILQYPMESIMAEIREPEKCNRRHFSLSQADWMIYQDLL